MPTNGAELERPACRGSGHYGLPSTLQVDEAIVGPLPLRVKVVRYEQVVQDRIRKTAGGDPPLASEGAQQIHRAIEPHVVGPHPREARRPPPFARMVGYTSSTQGRVKVASERGLDAGDSLPSRRQRPMCPPLH